MFIKKLHHPTGRSDMTLCIAAPPSGGTCEVEPSRGLGSVTLFKFNCSDWSVKNDKITSYEVYGKILLHQGHYSIITCRQFFANVECIRYLQII